jgi:glycosyltransferase involved in cell wall biosynthesis
MTDSDLTVIVGNYNHARYLPRCLDAILNQSVRPRELIVIDDCSQDDSMAVLEQYAQRDSVVRLVRHAKNQGVEATYNEGIRLARTKYLFLGAADDYVLPGFFEKSVTQLDANPHAGLCCGYDSHAYGYDGEIREFPTRWSEGPKYFQPDEVVQLVRRNLAAQATVVKKNSLVRIGMYRPELAWYCDWFAYLAIALREGMCHIPESLAVRTLGLEGAYSNESHNWGTEKHITVLGAMIDVIASDDFADIAPQFRKNGAISIFGTDLIRAAARRENRWDIRVLGLLNAFTTEQYKQLLNDPDPRVVELAGFFLGPFWKEEDAERQVLVDELERVKAILPPNGAKAKIRWATGKAIRKAGKMLGIVR